MDAKTARAILAEAAEGGWLTESMPEDEQELINLGQYYADEASAWVEEGNPADRHITAIIGLSQSVSPPVLSESAVHNHDGDPPGESIDYDYGVSQDVAKTYPRRSSGGYSESDLREEDNSEFIFDGLPLPRSIPEAPVEMPTDLTDLGDKAVRRLYSAFNSYHSRARWNLAQSVNQLNSATHLRDEALRNSVLVELRRARTQGEKPSQATLENLGKEDETYKEWSDRVDHHSEEVSNWQALRDIFKSNVDTLSREWTMRTEQYERER